MSLRAMVWALEVPCPSPLAKLVLIKLADHANEDGWECWPAQSRIAADCGMPRETVNRQIRALAEAGLIRVEQRTNGAGKLPNRYFLLCDAASHPDVILRHNPCDPASHKPTTEPTIKSSAPSERQPAEPVAATPADPVKEIFDRGLAILGHTRRSLLGRMRQQHGDEAVLAAIVACEAEQPSEPAAFFVGCMSRAPPRVNGKHPGTYRPGPIAALFEGGHNAAEAYIRKHQGDLSPDPAPSRTLLGRE